MKEVKAYIGDEKSIKDYLHFYFGCECEIDCWKDAEDDMPGSQKTRKVTELDAQVLEDLEWFKPTPILRQLSDMTEEELQECGNLVYDFSDDDSGMDLNNHRPDDFLLTTSEQFHWLIQRHFDVFGLIESGLAIDKTTLNKQS